MQTLASRNYAAVCCPRQLLLLLLLLQPEVPTPLRGSLAWQQVLVGLPVLQRPPLLLRRQEMLLRALFREHGCKGLEMLHMVLPNSRTSAEACHADHLLHSICTVGATWEVEKGQQKHSSLCQAGPR